MPFGVNLFTYPNQPSPLMLNQLTIRNYVLVDHLDIGFAPGLTGITGESGAGKSILIADKDSIDWQLVESAEHIGLSAGASAPESLVKDVVSKLKERYHIDVSEHGKIRETVNFKLPTIIAN